MADELVRNVCVISEKSVPLRVGVRLEEVDEDEGVEHWSFCELIRTLMWLSASTLPCISNAVRAVGDTVQHRKLSSGRQPLTSWSTLTEIVGTV